jgi:hypothetical protein
MIASGCGENCIAAAKSVLPCEVRREVRVAGIGQIAVCGPTNKAAFALGIVPACGFAVGNNRGDRLAWYLFPLLRRTCVASAAAWVTLIAASVVATVAIVSGALATALPELLLALILSLLIAVLLSLTSSSIAGPAASLLRRLLLREALGGLR